MSPRPRHGGRSAEQQNRPGHKTDRMELAEIARMEQQEEYYWWHIGRRLVLRSVLSAHLKPLGNLDVLDIGCGTGINYRWFKDWGKVTGLDSSREAIEYCRNHRAYDELVVSDASQLPENKFDIITAFDVLEHVQDDAAVLTKWFEGLKSGGHLFLTVPAYQWMFSAHDKALHHFRRYSAIGLRRKLRAAGFEVKFLSPFFFFTFPVVMLVRLLSRRKTPKTSYVETSSVVDTILVELSRFEAAGLSKGIGLPWGSSIVAIATKNLESGI